MCPEWPGHNGLERPQVPQSASWNGPSSAVCSPPGTGLRRVSKVVEDVMRATERPLISAELSGRKDTPCR